MMHNTADCMLLGQPVLQHAIAFLQELYWLAFSGFPVPIQCAKALNSHLKESSPYKFRHGLYNGDFLRFPPVKEARWVGTWERAFLVVAPWLWNSPYSLKFIIIWEISKNGPFKARFHLVLLLYCIVYVFFFL